MIIYYWRRPQWGMDGIVHMLEHIFYAGERRAASGVETCGFWVFLQSS